MFIRLRTIISLSCSNINSNSSKKKWGREKKERRERKAYLSRHGGNWKRSQKRSEQKGIVQAAWKSRHDNEKSESGEREKLLRHDLFISLVACALNVNQQPRKAMIGSVVKRTHTQCDGALTTNHKETTCKGMKIYNRPFTCDLDLEDSSTFDPCLLRRLARCHAQGLNRPCCAKDSPNLAGWVTRSKEAKAPRDTG